MRNPIRSLGPMLFLLVAGLPLAAQNITEFPLTAGSSPRSITAGPDGALWFTETDGNRIGRLTTDGALSEFPITTRDSFTLDIAAGSDGSLWFTEDGANRIARITTAGEVTEFQTGAFVLFEGPVAIAGGPDGNMWFTNWDAGEIGRITPAGAVTRFPIPFPSRFGPALADIVAGPDGALWFMELSSNSIGRITTAGVITQFPTDVRMQHIAAGPDGALWFTDGGSGIHRISTDGVVRSFAIPDPSAASREIVSGPDGNLWFALSGANSIGRLTPGGVFTLFPIPTPNSSPYGIAAGPDGNIWFTEMAGNKVGRLTLSTPAIDSRILPVVGSTAGVGGSFFRTAVQLHNPTTTLIAGRVVFRTSGISGTDADPAVVYSLQPGQTQSIADLLPAMGRSGLGSADVEVTAGAAPAMLVRVFNDAGAEGTTGFTEEPMRADDALRPGGSGALILPADLARLRLNIGVRSLAAKASATLTLRDAAGSMVAIVPRTFAETYHEQQSAAEFLGVTALPAGGSITIAVTEGAAIFYGATVDNTTGDPSLQIARLNSQQ
jgi:streptogramin lyase